MANVIIRRLLQWTLIAASAWSMHAFGEVNNASTQIQWGYKGNIGPERWGQLDPSFVVCDQGKEQSPINIKKRIKIKPYTLKLNYSNAPLSLMNEGTTELTIGHQTLIETEHAIQVNFSTNSNETITFKGQRYRLLQFHIHTPSENAWHNQTFPMEMHFVHQGDQGQLLVIGVFANGGQENAELQKVVNHLPSDKGKEHTITGQSINPAALMPEKKDYYSFLGSLTTPPCTEGVQWILMANPITISPAQMVRLRKAVGGVNARPLQSLYRRKIFHSLETT